MFLISAVSCPGCVEGGGVWRCVGVCGCPGGCLIGLVRTRVYAVAHTTLDLHFSSELKVLEIITHSLTRSFDCANALVIVLCKLGCDWRN